MPQPAVTAHLARRGLLWWPDGTGTIYTDRPHAHRCDTPLQPMVYGEDLAKVYRGAGEPPERDPTGVYTLGGGYPPDRCPGSVELPDGIDGEATCPLCGCVYQVHVSG